MKIQTSFKNGTLKVVKRILSVFGEVDIYCDLNNEIVKIFNLKKNRKCIKKPKLRYTLSWMNSSKIGFENNFLKLKLKEFLIDPSGKIFDTDNLSGNLFDILNIPNLQSKFYLINNSKDK